MPSPEAAHWIECAVVVARGAIAQRSATLFELGALGVQEDFVDGEAPPPRQPWDTGPPAPLPARALLRAWFEAGAVAAAALRALADWPGEVTVREVAEEDWAESWREGLERIVIAPDLVVAPPWKAEAGDLVIEPGMAFGTGEHPTTRACLEAIRALGRPGARCLDVGTGTGVLALAAARQGLGAWGVDTDPDAVLAARDNATRNGLRARFDQTPLPEMREPFELVVANLYAEVLAELAPDLVRLTAGHLVLAGVLVERAHLVEDALGGLSQVSRRVEGDWVSLHYARMS